MTITARLVPQRRRVGAVGLGDPAPDVGQQRDREPVLGGELRVGVEVLRGDADDGCVERGEVLGAIAVGAELTRAHRRFVTGVEEQHHPLAPVVREPERAVGALQLEVRRLLTDAGCLGNSLDLAGLGTDLPPTLMPRDSAQHALL